MRCPRASSETSNQNKKPAGACCASGPMSTFSNESLRTTQRARLLAVILVPRRPEMIRNAHLLNRFKTSQPLPSIQANPQKIDTPNASFGCFHGLTFPAPSATFILYLVEVRIPLVAGRAFRSASDARAKGAIADDPPKSPRQLNAVRGWGPGLRPVHCHP